MIVNPLQPVSFIYPTFDEQTGLFVAGNLYDVSTGTPVFLSQIAMTDILSDGVYIGQFTPAAGVSYLMVMLVYTNSGLTIVDTTRAPGAENYDAFTVNSDLLNFNYGAYDQASNLTVSAVVRDLTDSTQATVSMPHVLGGVYFGQYVGTLNKTYAVVKTTTDPNRPPGSDNFQSYTLTGGSTVNNNFFEATLIGQQLSAGNFNGGNVIKFTQGDNAVLQLTATDGQGNPINLTGATFTTLIKSANGSSVSSFNNSKHAIVSAPDGTFSLTLSPTDTLACGEGKNKEILSIITIGGNPVYYHGINMLTVYPPVPLQ